MKKIKAVIAKVRRKLTAPLDTRTREDLMVADPMYGGKTIEDHRADMRADDASTIRALAAMVAALLVVTAVLAVASVVAV